LREIKKSLLMHDTWLKTIKIRNRFLTMLDGRAHVEKLRVHCLNVAEVYV